jgi:hypothetical protein
MSNQFWVSNGNSPSQGSGTALASSTSLTDISPAPQYTLPYYLYVGQRIRLSAFGRFSTTATPTLLIGFYYGGVAGTALAASTAVTTGTATAWPWRASYNFRIGATGASGTATGEGSVTIGTSLTAETGTPIPATNANPVTINTTTLQVLTCGAQWGSSSASNTITCEDFIVELLN